MVAATLFSICRAHCLFQLIELLLRALIYIWSDISITATLDATPAYINAKIWPKYIQFQAEYKENLGVLRTEKREVPRKNGADKNMPAILQGRAGLEILHCATPQPTKKFKSDHSCAFDDQRISDNERCNAAFQDNIKTPGHLAAVKMISLMIMDIAFDVHCRAVGGPHTALESQRRLGAGLSLTTTK